MTCPRSDLIHECSEILVISPHLHFVPTCVGANTSGPCAREAGRGWATVSAGSAVNNHLPMQETRVRSLGQKDPLEEEMAAHSSILAWTVP